MAAAGYQLSVLQRAVQLVEEELRAGCRPPDMNVSGAKSAVESAAVRAIDEKIIGSRQTFRHVLDVAKNREGLVPDWSLYRATRYQQPAPAVLLRPAAAPAAETDPDDGERILAIGDLHNDPRHPRRLDVLTWIARYASEHRIGRIVQVGDWSTNDSVSVHDKNDTRRGRLKPPIKDDLDNLLASHQAFERGRSADYKPKRTFLNGNHEYRFERFENVNPEAHETFTLQRDQIFAQFGWNTRPYGEIWYCQGVGFTHHPINGAGRAFGGKTGPQRAANETTIAMVSGHTHRRQVHDAPKIGPLERVSMVEIGCGMLWGEVEDYVAHSLTGWWWGICPLTVRGGEITDLEFVSMTKLRSTYSDDGADRKAA